MIVALDFFFSGKIILNPLCLFIHVAAAAQPIDIIRQSQCIFLRKHLCLELHSIKFIDASFSLNWRRVITAYCADLDLHYSPHSNTAQSSIINKQFFILFNTITSGNLTISLYYIHDIITWYFPGAWLDTQTVSSSV